MLKEQYPDVLTRLPGRTDAMRHNIELLTTEPMRSKCKNVKKKVWVGAILHLFSEI